MIGGPCINELLMIGSLYQGNENDRQPVLTMIGAYVKQ